MQQERAVMLRAIILIHLGIVLQLGRADYTFNVDNVTENQFYYFSKATLEEILVDCDEHEVVFTETDQPEGCEFIKEFDPFHSLAGAVHTAYAGHLPLVLSPDHIWVTILQGIGIHNSLVSPDQQCYDQAGVSEAGSVVCESWNSVASIVQFGLDAKLPVEVTIPFLPFSTTSGAANMAAMTALAAPYEDNRCYDTKTYCGIPDITLSGTVQDWELLQQKVDSLLSKCTLDWWLCALKPVLAEFVKAARGQQDVSFWRNIYRFQPDQPQEGSGCWAASGWIMTLYPYITQREKGSYQQNKNLNSTCSSDFQWSVKPVDKGDECPDVPTLPSINTQDFPSGLTKIQFECQSNGDILILVGGFLGKCSQNDTHAVTPVLGWFVTNDSTSDVCQLSVDGHCEDDCACSGHGKCEKAESIGGAGFFGGTFGFGGGLFGDGGDAEEEKKTCKCSPGWSSVDCSRKCSEGTCGDFCGEFCKDDEVCDYVIGHCTAVPVPSPTMVQDSTTMDVTSSSPSPVASTKESTTADVTSSSPSPVASTQESTTTEVPSSSPSSVAATPEPSNVGGVGQVDVDDICQNMTKLKEVFCNSDVAGVVTLKSSSVKGDVVKGRFKFVKSKKSGTLSLTRTSYYYQVKETLSKANPCRFDTDLGDLLLLMGSSMNNRLVDLSSESLLKQCGENMDILEELSATSSCDV